MNSTKDTVDAFRWMHEVYSYPRSISGAGIKRTLRSIKSNLAYEKHAKIHKCSTGTRVFDWVVPQEWNFNRCQIIDKDGQNLIDEHLSLQVINFSLSLNDLMLGKDILACSHIGPADNPDAIPYVTSYYSAARGFCLSYNQMLMIHEENLYRAIIDTEHIDGCIEYLEYILPGKSRQEILFSSYCCHPELANNELSGPALLILIANHLSKNLDRRYTYRFFFGPETIGSIIYLSRRALGFKQSLAAGFVVSCVGKTTSPSIITSRSGDSYSDRVAKLAYQGNLHKFHIYDQLKRGSDERQYCSPALDLPVTVLTGHRFGDYEEYHTSMDNLKFITHEEFDTMRKTLFDVVYILEHDETYISSEVCEPMLSRYSLMPTINNALINQSTPSRSIKNLVHFSDGRTPLSSIAYKSNSSFSFLVSTARCLADNGKLTLVSRNRILGIKVQQLLIYLRTLRFFFLSFATIKLDDHD